jgi:hypothetical protein
VPDLCCRWAHSLLYLTIRLHFLFLVCLVNHVLRFLRRCATLDLSFGKPFASIYTQRAHCSSSSNHFASIILLTYSCLSHCIDTRRRMVQTLPREHLCWCLPQGGSWRLSSIPLRKSIFGSIRGCYSHVEPSSRRQGPECYCTFRTGHSVSITFCFLYLLLT